MTAKFHPYIFPCVNICLSLDMCEDHCLRAIRRHHLSDHQSGLNRLNDIQMLNIGLVGCPTPRKKMGVKNERDVQVGFFLRKIIILRELSPHK